LTKHGRISFGNCRKPVKEIYHGLTDCNKLSKSMSIFLPFMQPLRFILQLSIFQTTLNGYVQFIG
jgi:hypothetical protein